jgi:hypothetical protein
MNHEVYPLGTKIVLLDNEKQIGTIIGYYVCNQYLKYDVEWWEAGDVKSRLFHQFTVKSVNPTDKIPLGFRHIS